MANLKCVPVIISLAILASCNSSRSSNTAATPTADVFAPRSIDQFGLRGTKTLSLTFDDGPGAGTSAILDVLAEYKIKATFFVLGRSAKAFPALMERIRREGHIVASHTYGHETLTGGRYRGGPLVVTNLVQTHNAIAAYQDPKHGKYFRAPGGAWPGRVAASLNAHPVMSDYVGPIFWDIGGTMGGGHSADWRCWSRRLSVDRCLAGYLNETEAKQGGVVLFHDITTNSAVMVRQYIETVNAQGYRFVTLDELPNLNYYR